MIPYKTQQRQAFWMTRTSKNLKIVCVKFFGKIGRKLVPDLTYVIVRQSLHLKLPQTQELSRRIENTVKSLK